MSLSGIVRAQHMVDLIEEADLAIRVFKRGPPRPDGCCDLTIAVNGRERLNQTEPAGPNAPSGVVIDLRVGEAFGEILIGALPSRPWMALDMPIIAYAVPQDGDPVEAGIKYLLRTPVVEQVIDSIRTALDLDCDEPISPPESDGGDWMQALATG